jgi:(2S)-methylsuccinyl-CoA dehydrogenase
MTHAQVVTPSATVAAEKDLLSATRVATGAVEALLADATARVRSRVAGSGRLDARAFDREQRATHGLAWLATYAEAVRQLAAYAERMHANGTLGEIEELLVRIGTGEYLAQVVGGIPMSQVALG